MCKCGCNTCGVEKPTLMLNENLAPRAILSEGLKYHLDTKKPLTEHLYRAGSTNYFNLWAESRSLYSRQILEITNKDDLQILTETDLGHYGILEQTSTVSKRRAGAELKQKLKGVRSDGFGKYDATVYGLDSDGKRVELKSLNDLNKFDKFELAENKKVPLDFPIELTEDEAQKEANFILNKILQQLQNIDTENIQNSKDLIVALEKLDTSFIKALEKLDTSLDFVASAITGRDTLDISVDQDTYGKFASAKESLLKEIIVRVVEGKKVPLDFPMLGEEVNSGDLNEAYSTYEQRMINQIKRFKKEGLPMFNLPIKTQKFYAKHKKEIDALDETEINEEAKKKIGKPMRDSSGGKAYKVYVKDPKTKKIKTVRFGSGGLRAKINDKKARNAFAKRHKCSTKKDKTKAGYWSCRLPRYAKQLGLKSNFGGFW